MITGLGNLIAQITSFPGLVGFPGFSGLQTGLSTFLKALNASLQTGKLIRCHAATDYCLRPRWSPVFDPDLN
ncbi:hypothetical protein MP213Fo_21430 [Pseudochrobactrum sp. MP213Fo]